MKRISKCTSIAISLSLLACIETASAAESGVYLGVNAGQSNFNFAAGSFKPGNEQANHTDAALSVEVGYTFIPYFSLEASYIDFGKTTYSYSDPFAKDIGSEVALQGMSLSAVGTLPISQFEINGKLGAVVARSTVSHHFLFANSPTRYEYSSTSESTEVMLGLGAGYTLAQHFHFRTDVTLVQGAGDGDGSPLQAYDVSLWTLGFQYRF